MSTTYVLETEAPGSVQTIDATLTTITTCTPPRDGTYTVEASLNAYQDTGAGGGGWVVLQTFRVLLGVVTAIGVTTAVHTATDNVLWGVVLDTDGTVFRARVQGSAGVALRWTVRCVLAASV